jgi:hypothetical protein
MRICCRLIACQINPVNAATNAAMSKILCRVESFDSRLLAIAVPAIMYKKKIVI